MIIQPFMKADKCTDRVPVILQHPVADWSYLVCAGDAAGKCDEETPDRAALHMHLSTNTGPKTL